MRDTTVSSKFCPTHRVLSSRKGREAQQTKKCLFYQYHLYLYLECEVGSDLWPKRSAFMQFIGTPAQILSRLMVVASIGVVPFGSIGPM